MKSKQKSKVLFFSIVGVIVLLIIASAAIAYQNSLNDSFTMSLRKIYPAAIVGNTFISLYDWQNYLTVAHNLDDAASLQNAEAAHIKAIQEAELLKKFGISSSGQQFDQEYSFLTSNKSPELATLVTSYFENNMYFFDKYFVDPQVYDALLRIHYNDDMQLNADAYNQAESLLKRIQNGEKFDDLAKLSDDKATGQFGGDLGFVSKDEILPELQDAIAKAPVGSVYNQIVVSRDGYHIIEVVDTSTQNGQETWHVKHILIETTGYDNWLSQQLNNVAVWQIVK